MPRPSKSTHRNGGLSYNIYNLLQVFGWSSCSYVSVDPLETGVSLLQKTPLKCDFFKFHQYISHDFPWYFWIHPDSSSFSWPHQLQFRGLLRWVPSMRRLLDSIGWLVIVLKCLGRSWQGQKSSRARRAQNCRVWMCLEGWIEVGIVGVSPKIIQVTILICKGVVWGIPRFRKPPYCVYYV